MWQSMDILLLRYRLDIRNYISGIKFLALQVIRIRIVFISFMSNLLYVTEYRNFATKI